MRLIKQSFLYFKEGNSDKVYEIDLCDVGNDTYVVNFRYGRRGAQLKEGCKTPVPVSRSEAEKIYDTVETEKLSKGYTTSATGVGSLPLKAAFTLNSNSTIDTAWMLLPEGRRKAILQRLHSAINGTAGNARFQWKLSRIIWKAGEYKIKEAVPYILQLFSNGSELHQYCCTWALVRCFDATETAAAALQTIHQTHPAASIAKLAGAGWAKHSSGTDKEAQLSAYINRLPEALKKAVESESEKQLLPLLNERFAQQQPNYNWLEDLYIISTQKRWLRSGLKTLLNQAPLRPNYFKHIRAIFKLAQLLDDFEITGLLACRFEREQEMFSHHTAANDTAGGELFVPEIEEWVKPVQEFKKSNSRLAYSQKTRWYFHGRILRQLQLTGKNNDTAYVQLATALLTGYKHDKDFREHYSVFNYVWKRNNSYERVETRFLQNAQAVFLHQILSGDNPDIVLQRNHAWRMRNDAEEVIHNSNTAQKTGEGEGLGGFLKKITGLFGKKKEQPAPPPRAETPAPVSITENKNGTPFIHLWNALPQAYLQLLLEAEMEEVHQFAAENLTAHTEFTAIKQRLGKQECIQLLASMFAVPARFGYAITTEKYAATIPDDDLVAALLNSIDASAQQTGKQWTEKYSAAYFKQSGFITALLFAKHADIRSWARSFLKNTDLTTDIKNAVTGKAIATLMAYGGPTPENEIIIKDAGDTLFELFGEALTQVNISVTADLLQHQHAGVLLFGLRLLKAQKQQLNLAALSKVFLFGLLQHPNELVRAEGISLLQAMPEEQLLQHRNDIISSCLSVFENVRRGLAPVVQRMAAKDSSFGINAAELLMPVLLRKETTAGLHADVSYLLCNQLSAYLQNANKETALNLLYSHYSAAQNVGVMILEKYTTPAQLTLPQVIALGAHENINVREWCWKFYNEQSARIKYEKESSIKLLESKWADTRQFAMQYFREQFTENDWSPETLITLADSVKADVEAFGRELITKFFTEANGQQYLLKLSQHPGEKMQLFATNYLERFAAGDTAKLQSLEFYFRSVLTRVNKSRIAKNRIFHFLLQEGRRSEEAAKLVSAVLTDVSATAAIGDKAKCIDILLQLKALYDVQVPLRIKATAQRTV